MKPQVIQIAIVTSCRALQTLLILTFKYYVSFHFYTVTVNLLTSREYTLSDTNEFILNVKQYFRNIWLKLLFQMYLTISLQIFFIYSSIYLSVYGQSCQTMYVLRNGFLYKWYFLQAFNFRALHESTNINILFCIFVLVNEWANLK